MQIVDLTVDHIKMAVQLAKQNYEDERGFVPALPPDKYSFNRDLEQGLINHLQKFLLELGRGVKYRSNTIDQPKK